MLLFCKSEYFVGTAIEDPLAGFHNAFYDDSTDLTGKRV